MKVLVTGGAGYMGSVLTAELLGQGHQVSVLDYLSFGGAPLLSFWHDSNFRFYQGDIRSRDVADSALDGVEAVVHLAAIVGDPACAREPDLTREVNLDAALRMFESSRRSGIKRFIFASTCSNYGKMSSTEEYATEESDLSPVSLYAETKVAVERALLDMSAGAAPVVTLLRFATLFGISPRMRFDLTVNEFTKDLLTKGALEVYGEQFWRPYVHVHDAARAIVLALSSPADRVAGHVFNVGDNDQNYTKGDLVKLIDSCIGKDLSISYVHRDEDPRDYRVSFEKIRRELGFNITRTVDDGIREIIEAINLGIFTDFSDPRYRN